MANCFLTWGVDSFAKLDDHPGLVGWMVWLVRESVGKVMENDGKWQGKGDPYGSWLKSCTT